MNAAEIWRLARKWNIDLIDLRNTWSVKMNIERSRREQLDLKAEQMTLKRKFLVRTGRLAKWKKETRKR